MCDVRSRGKNFLPESLPALLRRDSFVNKYRRTALVSVVYATVSLYHVVKNVLDAENEWKNDFTRSSRSYPHTCCIRITFVHTPTLVVFSVRTWQIPNFDR